MDSSAAAAAAAAGGGGGGGDKDYNVDDDNYYNHNGYGDYNNVKEYKSVFDGPMPTQARRKMVQVTMRELDDSNTNNDDDDDATAIINNSDDVIAGYNLFDALDRHLRALDEQIETSTSLGSVLDEQLSSVEMEYDESESGGESFRSSWQQEDDESEEIIVSYEQQEGTDTLFYEEPTDYELQPSEMFAAAAETNSNAVLVTRPDPDNLNEESTYNNHHSNEPSQQTYDKSSPLDSAQTTNNAHIIGIDSFGFSTIHAEATHSFETYQHPNSKFVAIQHCKTPPPLPDTTDPYELLGFTYHNPPRDADDIRRAYVQRAKKYHPDALHPASNDQERELAAKNFKKINDAYRKVKDEKWRLQQDYFAVTMGGAMYEPRGNGRHIRRPFSYGRGDFDESESLFAGSYSARHGTRYGGGGSGEPRRFWEKRKTYNEYQKRERRSTSSSSNGREKRNPFGRRNHHEVADNCHVSGDQFPPFFSY